MLKAVLPYSARVFKRAIIMPNIDPPVVNAALAIQYKDRILSESSETGFVPLMTLYLTDETTAATILEAHKVGVVAVKCYPANATTNSSRGVTDMANTYSALSAMQEVGMPLLLHGETVARNGVELAPNDREKAFLDSVLPRLISDFPELKIVLEHATTKDAVDFVTAHDPKFLGSTITVHHLARNNKDVMHSSEPAHLQCMPIIKSPEDQRALLQAVTSGDEHFFLGTDSAPHPLSKKQGTTPPSGVFTAPAALEMYAEIFDEEQKLGNLERFASLNGPKFYGLPPNDESVTLTRESWLIESDVKVENGEFIRPFGFADASNERHEFRFKVSSFG